MACVPVKMIADASLHSILNRAEIISTGKLMALRLVVTSVVGTANR